WAVVGFSKEPHPPEVFPVDGVSTYLALTFGTLLSSQGTDASFVPVSPGSPGASLRSCVFDSIRSLRARFSPARFRLSASSRFRLYQIRFRFDSGSDFRRRSASEQLFALPFRRGYYFSGFPWRLIIGSAGSNFGNAKEDPLGNR
ncbi:hypothetical protein, partial [Streptomyces sp. WAC01526]|uniref:hypothetical protein n=1 Tax=Streptomyces sp. WAC01526 TaxID=2588709 RepID=UPI0011DFDB08